MRNLFIFALLLPLFCYSQQQTYDLTSYREPAGWKKQTSQNGLQLSKENTTDGSYCLITLFKSLPGSSDAKSNFDAAWETVVKEMVKTSSAPERQPSAIENGWETVSGYAPYESDGQKGLAVLVTSTGYDLMVNILILTNSNAYEKEMTAFLESVTLLKPTGGNNAASNAGSKIGNNGTSNTVSNSSRAISNGFAFNTTNFDDGWTSTVQEDWVEVRKNNIRVLVHYPNKIADAYHSVLMDGLKNAWNVLVANRYSSGSNFEFKPVSSWQSIEFAEADLVEKGSGKTVHVVLFKMNYSNGSGRYLEFITENKKAFEAVFGAYHTESYGWEPMEKMVNYNKFAVSATDLKGKWTSNFSGLTQYVNANTGASAGADTHASSQEFEFIAGNGYRWTIAMASGFTGNIRFQNAKSAGRFSMTGNWQVNFSDIEGKPRSYPVHFSCIKGARILWIDGTGYGKSE